MDVESSIASARSSAVGAPSEAVPPESDPTPADEGLAAEDTPVRPSFPEGVFAALTAARPDAVRPIDDWNREQGIVSFQSSEGLLTTVSFEGLTSDPSQLLAREQADGFGSAVTPAGHAVAVHDRAAGWSQAVLVTPDGEILRATVEAGSGLTTARSQNLSDSALDELLGLLDRVVSRSG